MLILIVQVSYSQWEKTNWKNDGQIYNIWVAGKTIIAGLNDNGFIISIDLGENWQTCNNGLPLGISANSIAINGNNLYLGSFGGLYVSTDLGKNWDQKFIGLPDFPIVETIAVSGNTIIVGTGNSGIYISTDNGNTWAAKNKGLGKLLIITIFVLNNNIFASTGSGVYLSTDNGNNWIQKNNGLNLNLSAKKFIKAGNNIYALINGKPSEICNELYKTTDMGDTWINQKINLIYDAEYCSLNTIGVNLILSIGDTVLYVSSDMGVNWIKKRNGFQYDYNIIIYPVIATDENLLAVRNCEIYLSSDMGNSWIVKRKSLAYGAINTIGVTGNNIFVGCQPHPLSTYQNGLFISQDLGDTWVPSGWDNTAVRLLDIKNSNILAATTKGVYLSSNLGISWNKQNLEFYIYSILYYKNYMFVGTGYGVYFSTDMGENWQVKNNGLKDSIIQALYINDNYQLASTNHGIYLSTDMGEKWQVKANGLPKDLNVFSITMLNNNIFAGTYGGLYKSTDFGETWQVKTNGLPEKPYILTFFIVGNNIFAGDDTYGVFLSTDNGETWITKNDGLKNLNIGNFAILNDYIFVSVGKTNGAFGENGPALYRAKISDLMTDVETNEEAKSNVIFPNPATDYIEIKPSEGWQPSDGWQPSEGSNIKIYNTYGEIVFNIASNQNKTQRIDISKLAGGIYFIMIDNKVEKFVKI